MHFLHTRELSNRKNSMFGKLWKNQASFFLFFSGVIIFGYVIDHN